jgi:hypothetical protein
MAKQATNKSSLANRPSQEDAKLDAEVRCNTWLADGNAAAEAGNHAKAERCYAKSQFWLDRYNRLAGNS